MKDGINQEVFRDYVRYILKTENDPERPVCPFPGGGECYISDREGKCQHCEVAEKAYLKKLDSMRDRNGHPVRVFCVSCGAGKRTPLRRWHNSYICENCWKILRVIGEEKFIERITGEEEPIDITKIDPLLNGRV